MPKQEDSWGDEDMSISMETRKLIGLITDNTVGENISADVIDLIDRGADIDGVEEDIQWIGKSALSIAVINKDVETIRVLLQKGADPSKQDRSGNTPLHFAVRCYHIDENSVDIVKILIENNADISVLNNRNVSIMSEAKNYINQKRWIDNEYNKQAYQEVMSILEEYRFKKVDLVAFKKEKLKIRNNTRNRPKIKGVKI